MSGKKESRVRKVDFSVLSASDVIWMALWGDVYRGKLVGGGNRPNFRRPEVPKLRQRINTIQHTLFNDVTARGIAVLLVGLAKQKLGEDVFVPDRHQAVIDQWRKWSEDLGAPPEVVENYFMPAIVSVMEGAVAIQELIKSDPDFR